MNHNTLALSLCLLITSHAYAQAEPAQSSATNASAETEAAVAALRGYESGENPSRVLGLNEALAQGQKYQPLLRQAQASTEASRARVNQARAGLLPQITASAAYQARTANFVQQPGLLPSNATVNSRTPTFDLFNFFNFGLTASQLVYDFGASWKRRDAAAALVAAREDDERATQLQVAQNVRVAFFNARAAKALVAVVHDTLTNTERHLRQIEGFVRAGTRAEIDLAQARTDRANAQVGIINQENSYAAAKATLNQAMGVEADIDYDVSDDSLPAVDGEDGSLDVLVQRALGARPEFVSLAAQVRSQELTVGSIKGGYFPSLGVSTGLTDAGRQLNNLTWNWNAGATLTWQIFQGGITNAQVDEARAVLVGLYAQVDSLRQQTRLEVEQARLAVRADKAVMVASEEVVRNAQERMRLAEGRYSTGVGNIIELADAQLALTQALAQQVQSEYNLSAARAGLLHALGAP